MIQSKLNMIEDTVCWVNEEEALFKFPQSSYQDIGDITVKATLHKLNIFLLTLSGICPLTNDQIGFIKNHLDKYDQYVQGRNKQHFKQVNFFH